MKRGNNKKGGIYANIYPYKQAQNDVQTEEGNPKPVNIDSATKKSRVCC